MTYCLTCLLGTKSNKKKRVLSFMVEMKRKKTDRNREREKERKKGGVGF